MNTSKSVLTFFSDPGLYSSFGLILVVLFIAFIGRLEIKKDLIFSSLRGFVQLSTMGFVLLWIFSLKNPWAIVITLGAMTLLAGSIAKKRGGNIPHALGIVTLSLGFSLTFTLGVMLITGTLDTRAQVLIPLGGMILGNSMNGASLCLDRLQSEIQLRKAEITLILSLGGNPRQAMETILQKTLQTSLIPAMDTLKALGVIFMPGMMSGLILAGQSPLLAVKYQIVVMFMLLTSASLTNLLVLQMAYRGFFNTQMQLKKF